MSTEQYGRRVLDECHEESLDELLKELRARISPRPKDVLGVDSLDRLLELFRYHETTTEAPAGGLEGIEDESEESIAFQRQSTASSVQPPVIDITSQHSAAGKTTLLYYLTAKALLPNEHGGKNSIVVWIDTDGRFSASRLHQIMCHLMKKTSIQSNEPIARNALQHLYVLTPSTAAQLLTQLSNLPDDLLNHPSTSTNPRPLSLLVLDSATAFHHQDRFDTEMTRLEAGADYASHPKSPSRTTLIITALKAIQARFECSIAFTTHAATGPPTAPSHPPTTTTNDNHPPHPPATTPSISPYTTFATLSLTITRLPVSRFAPSMTLEECLRDREKRAEAVGLGKFAVGVDRSSSERWRAGMRERVAALEGRGRVGMVVGVGDGGVDVG